MDKQLTKIIFLTFIPILFVSCSLHSEVQTWENTPEISPQVQVNSGKYQIHFTNVRTEITTFPVDDQEIDLPHIPGEIEPPPKVSLSEADIPTVINSSVIFFIKYYRTTERQTMIEWLVRSNRYVPMMKEILKEEGLPQDLVYVAMVESGFDLNALSPSGAVGPWQFMYQTAIRHGLRVDWWIDERKDPEKSTIAAAKFLKYLYDKFGSWHLAIGAYNSGEAKIFKAIQKNHSLDFWKIRRSRYLNNQTRNFVPKIIAATLIAKNPEHYGFTGLSYQKPIEYDKVKINEPTSLKVIVRMAGVSLKEMKKLNPQLNQGCTPPGHDGFEIKLPKGRGEIFKKNMAQNQPKKKLDFRRHVVKKGDTLSEIAYWYGTTVQSIKEINNISDPDFIEVETRITIPIDREIIIGLKGNSSNTRNKFYRSGNPNYEPEKRRNGETEKRETPNSELRTPNSAKDGTGRSPSLSEEREGRSGESEIIYLVKKGDTLWNIGQKHMVKPSQIAKWNNLNMEEHIHPGDKLKILIQ